MELRVLKYFLVAAREENITKAAALLHVTQPTLSRQLMQLEEELGVKLFRRGKYRVSLTEHRRVQQHDRPVPENGRLPQRAPAGAVPHLQRHRG